MYIGFVVTPNLPEKLVNTVIIGSIYTELSKSLKELGISVIGLPPNNMIHPKLAYHADMSLFHLSSNKIVATQDAYGFLSNGTFELTSSVAVQAIEYPYNVSLNACLVGNILFHRNDLTDPAILEKLGEQCYTRVNVMQGYTKCSICLVDETHIISADSGICRVARKYGVESLLISPGQIELDGFSYGFIGGSSGKISKNQLAFTGSLRKHKDERAILEFAKSAGVEVVYLSDEEIYDVGSIIPIYESDD